MTSVPLPADKPSRGSVIKAISGALGFGILVLLTNLAVSVAVSYLYRAYQLQNASQTVRALLDILAYFALLAPGALFLLLFFRKDKGPDFSGSPWVPRLPFLFIPMAIGAGYLNSIWTDSLFGIIFDRFSQSASAEDFYTEPVPVLLYFVSVVILPAILEEWIYRGLLLKHLLPIGKTAAIILSALIFGLSHISLSQSMFAFAVGIPLGIAYAETGKIRFGVVIHGLTNLISFGISYWALVWPQDWINGAYNVMIVILINALIVGVIVYSILGASARRHSRLAQTWNPAGAIPAGGNAKWIFANPLFYLLIIGFIALLFLYYGLPFQAGA